MPSLVEKMKSSGLMSETLFISSWIARSFFQSTSASTRRSGIGKTRTLPAVLVLPTTHSRLITLPFSSKVVSTVWARTTESVLLCSLKSFHLSASTSPMRNPANMDVIHKGLNNMLPCNACKNLSRNSSGIALYSCSSAARFVLRSCACKRTLSAGFLSMICSSMQYSKYCLS